MYMSHYLFKILINIILAEFDVGNDIMIGVGLAWCLFRQLIKGPVLEIRG